VAVSVDDLARAEQGRKQRLAGIRAYLRARAAAASGDRTAALDALKQSEPAGAAILPGPQDPLAGYLADADFAPVFAALRDRVDSTANGRLAVDTPSPPVAAESLAYDSRTRRFFLSNWHDNAIYTLTFDGHLARYFALPELTPNGVKIDLDRRRLWFVATNAFRDGAAEPRSQLWSVDLATGAATSFAATGAKGFNDLAIAPNGNVYVTDTPGGALYVLRAGSPELRRFLPDEKFQQPNGIAVGDTGRHLFVAQGLDILTIDLGRNTVEAVQVPPRVETLGTDGLVFRDGKLYAIQNLLTRGTVLELELDAARTKVTLYRFLDQADPMFDLPTAGTFAGDRLYVLAGTQLYRYGRDRHPAPGEIKPLRLLAYGLCR
jgi:sugar lactone lactonase YvrE